MYDHIWTIRSWDFRTHNLGPKVQLIDFTASGESFISYHQSGEIAVWSIEDKQFREVVYRVGPKDMPLSKIRVIQEDKIFICYSRVRLQFLIIKRSEQLGTQIERLKLEDSGNFYGECTNYQIDNTSSFIVATFAQSNKLIVIDITTLEIKLEVCDPDILLKKVWLDETGCFLSTLNRNETQVEIYIFQWKYELTELPKLEKTPMSRTAMELQAEAMEKERLAR